MAEEEQAVEQEWPGAQRFTELVGRAESLVDLRRAWDEADTGIRTKIFVSEAQFESMVEVVRDKFQELGLDLAADDERIQHLQTAISLTQADEHGEIRLSESNQTMTAIHRILSGCDPQAEGLVLLPLEGLEPVTYWGSLRNLGLKYTEDDQYVILSEFPRKAVRRVTDPESPFWGFVVYTDTWPGKQKLNASLWIPAGRVSRDSMLRMLSERSSERQSMEADESYVPRLVRVQALQLGDSHNLVNDVDTTNGLVRAFFEEIKSELGKD